MKHIKSKKTKKDGFLTSKQRASLVSLILLLLIISITVVVLNRLRPSHAASSTSLSISPTSQTVSAGSDVTVTVSFTAGGASILSAQSVLSYNPTDFSFVSASPGAAFNGAFPYTTASGSITFTAGSSFTNGSATPITTNQTVAVIVLQATGSGGTSSISLASVCPTGNFSSSCSAAWDSGNSNNDLGSVSSPGSYVVSPATTSPPPTTTTPPSTGTPPSSSPPPSVKSSGGSSASTKPNQSASSGSSSSGSVSTPISLSGGITTSSPIPTSTTQVIPTYDLTITILGSNKKPVKGVVVNLNGEKATTNSKGIASLRAIPGTYDYTVSGKGIKTYKGTVTVQVTTQTQQFEALVKPAQSFPLLIVSLVVIGVIAIVTGLYLWKKHNDKFPTTQNPVPMNPPVDHLDHPATPIAPTPSNASIEPKVITPSSEPNVIAPTESNIPPHIITATPGHVIGKSKVIAPNSTTVITPGSSSPVPASIAQKIHVG